MADTLPNISITANEWRDLYAASGIPVGTAIAVENVGVCDVYLTVAATQPDPEFNKYNVVKRDGPQYGNDPGSSGAWAFCQGSGAKVNVREL